MRVLGNLSVQVKILAAIGVAVVVGIVIGVVGLVALSRASAASDSIYRGNVSSVSALGHIRALLAEARLATANHMISGDATGKARFAQAFTEDSAALAAALQAYRSGDPAVPDAELAELADDFTTYRGMVQNSLLPAGDRNDLAAWQSIRDDQVMPLMDEVGQDLLRMDAVEQAAAASTAAAAHADYVSSRTVSITLLVAGSLAALALGVLVARKIIRSLQRVQQVCEALAEGDLTRTAGLAGRDEPGLMAQALDRAVGRLRETVTTIGGSAATLAGATERMSGVAGRIASAAGRTSTQAEAVSSAAERISRSVDTVSAGSEEMGAAIREISRNAAEAAEVAAGAVRLSSDTSGTMNKLGESSAEIGNVIKVITQIAEQTNLLALNATIEAARAGDAGKGFAVVATEVKDLAQETARATEDISRRVQAIQGDTGSAIAAIDEITRVISRISDFQTTIASAVEQQTATTAEMNRSVAEAATGTGAIAQNITGVAGAARETDEGAAQAQATLADLTRTSGELVGVVSRFRH